MIKKNKAKVFKYKDLSRVQLRNVWHTLQEEYRFIIEQQFNETANPDAYLKCKHNDVKNVLSLRQRYFGANDVHDRFQSLYRKLLKNPQLLIDGSDKAHDSMMFLSTNYCDIKHYRYNDDGVLKDQDKITQESYWGILAHMITWKRTVDIFYDTFNRDEVIQLPQFDLKTNEIVIVEHDNWEVIKRYPNRKQGAY